MSETKLTAEQARERLQLDTEVSKSGCWLWTGSRTNGGYGRVTLQGEYWGTHRLSFHFFVHHLPKDTVVHHKCAEPACWNPFHLQATTHHQNTAEMMSRNRLERELAAQQETIADLLDIIDHLQ